MAGLENAPPIPDKDDLDEVFNHVFYLNNVLRVYSHKNNIFSTPSIVYYI